jgi:hypothetical protein
LATGGKLGVARLIECYKKHHAIFQRHSNTAQLTAAARHGMKEGVPVSDVKRHIIRNASTCDVALSNMIHFAKLMNASNIQFDEPDIGREVDQIRAALVVTRENVDDQVHKGLLHINTMALFISSWESHESIHGPVFDVHVNSDDVNFESVLARSRNFDGF